MRRIHKATTLANRPSVPLTAANIGIVLGASGYWNANVDGVQCYSDVPPTTPCNLDDPINYWNDLSSSANPLVSEGGSVVFWSDLASTFGAVGFANAPDFLNTSNTVNLTGAFTLFMVVDQYGGAENIAVFGSTTQNNIVIIQGDTFAGFINGSEFGTNFDIPGSGGKAIAALWRTNANVLKAAATGITTTVGETKSGTLTLSRVGGTNTGAGYFISDRLLAAAIFPSDVSSRLPEIATALGTTLTL